MPEGSKVASRKKPITESIHDRDRIIVRLPDGMRDRIAAMAVANGRSLTAEVVAALEHHLKGADRLTQLWEFFEAHKGDIEAIGDIDSRLDSLESDVRPLIEERAVALAARSWEREQARLAGLPPITAEQAEKIRALIGEIGVDETRLLRVLNATRIEEIKDFERAMSLIDERRRRYKNPPA
jgi:hypothetical protein